MKKSLNLYKGQKQYKEPKKPYRSRPIRKVSKSPKQTSKERYYKDKAIKAVDKASKETFHNNRTLNIHSG